MTMLQAEDDKHRNIINAQNEENVKNSNSNCGGGGDGKGKKQPWLAEDGTKLTLLSLNMEYYQQYKNATNKQTYEKYLKDQVATVDVLCIQEDLLMWSDEFMKATRPFDGFRRIVSSFEEQAAHDSLTRKNKNMFLNHDDGFTSTLGNSIYLNIGVCKDYWTVTAQNVVQISSALLLPNGIPLCYRSAVCATLVCQDMDKPVQVLCTHLSGGRFEDAHMESPLMKGERARQMQSCLDQKDAHAYNILVGDFNASATRTQAMDSYLKILQSEQTLLKSSDFYSYMMAPFTTLASASAGVGNNQDWKLLYDILDGPTSRFGHVIDFYVTSPHISVVPTAIERVRMVQQYMEWVIPTADDDFKDYKTITKLEESITDHNAVKVTFSLPQWHIREATWNFYVTDNPTAAMEWGNFKWMPLPLRTPQLQRPTITRYPILQYQEGLEGPTRVGVDNAISVVDLINNQQLRILDEFQKSEWSTASLKKFMKDCAVVERMLLNTHGWRVLEDWYYIEQEETTNDVLTVREKMTHAHKSFQEETISVWTLRQLIKCSLVKEDNITI